MTLQNKTLLAISTCMAGTIIAIYLFSGIIVSESFQQLENNYAQDNTRRVMEVVTSELDYLSAFSAVYADRYAANPIPDEQFISRLTNDLGRNMQGSLRYNLVAIFDHNGDPVGGVYYDPDDPVRNDLPVEWRGTLTADHPLYVPRGSSGRAQGIIRTPEGRALLLSATRFTATADARRERGTFILGRIFDAGELQRLSRVSKMSLQLIDLAAIPSASNEPGFYRSLISGAPYQVRVRDETTINGYVLLKDTRQQPVFVLETTLPRDIYNQGQATLGYFTKLLFIIGALTILTAGLLMNRLVLARIKRLGREISRFHAADSTSERVMIGGSDEFTRLADKFNHLLAGLQNTRQELEKQVAERVAAESELTRNQELYRRAEAIVKLGHWEWDEIGDRMVACSEQYAAIYGMTVAGAITLFSRRENELETIHRDDRERVAQAIRQAVENRSGLDIEYRIVTGNGITKHIHRVSEPIISKNGRLIRSVGTLQDITRQKQAQERLEQYQKRLSVLMSELALVEEQERRRIATGLHDSTIQNLGLSKFKLFVLQKSLPENIPQGPLNEVIETIDRAINDTRSLVFELSPPVLYELGFVPAVEWLAEQIYLQRGLVCEVYSDDLPKPLENTIMVMLFQIVRELLVNIAKHAQATRATVQINRIADRVMIKVTDDGSGFEIGALEDSTAGQRGFGLFSIRERLVNIGEHLSIESIPGQGTSISFSVPVQPEDKVAA